MNQFGIYSPVLGKREDVPNIFLQKALTPDILNCQFWQGKVRTSYGRTPELQNASGVSVATPDGQPILKYLNHQSDSASKHLLVFTALHAYRWDDATNDYVTLHTCATTSTIKNWSVAPINGKVVATNNVDAPIVWDGGTGTTFGALNASIASGVTISRAAVCCNYENHIVFGNYDLSNGESYEGGIILSDLDDETEWQTGDASAFYSEGAGVVNGMGKKDDLLYVFKTRSARIFWYTGTDAILNSRSFSNTIGTFSPDSVGNDGDGNLYFFSSDLAIREVDAGRISSPMIDNAIRRINHETDVVNLVQFAYVPEYNECWWACPVDGSDTNNVIFCYQQGGIWYERDQAVSAFGVYERSVNYTWDNQPEGTWDDWTGVWNDASEAAGWQSDICSDYDGYTYRSHASSDDIAWDGSEMVSTGPVHRFVMSTDLGDKAALRYYKRLLYMYAYFTSIGGDPASIYIKQDNEAQWQLAGTIATDGDADITIGELALDTRARHFLVKIESSSPFEFLGAEFEYLPSGLR